MNFILFLLKMIVYLTFVKCCYSLFSVNLHCRSILTSQFSVLVLVLKLRVLVLVI